ncbi:hypothetical protein GOHSU_25_00340 [Gordonia hirsuta DSM 44140 = NBRC 16056]|uniref:Phasin domain-containing protein n=1 Tax=Gordonia hirsuta DSM 44140 = NBRC 16056 TaxID=1121927 RepID=L7LA44_9ACTN|nr:hypothetical protein [Gordonia hirsuta]GAC57799.1 hypothetical protein GOHSU_25_00340 [Gordonia hirsuta DSM 44140 = NBRC 16056]
MAAEDSPSTESDVTAGSAGTGEAAALEGLLTNPLAVPFAVFTRSQEQAIKVATDTLNKVRAMTSAGVATSSDVLMQQVTDLSGAVVGMAGSATGLAGAVSQPLQEFIVQQRQMSETIAKFAAAQAELAAIVAEFAQRQAATVAAVERITNPVFELVGTKHPDGDAQD